MVKLTNIGGIMCIVNVYDAKTNFSKYLEMLESGKEKEIVVARYGKKIAKIVLIDAEETPMRIGAGKAFFPKNIEYDLTDEKYYSLEDWGL